MTVLEQFAALIALLNEVKTLCDDLLVAANAQSAAYNAAVAAQAEASNSLTVVIDKASQVIAKIGN